jgi:hypothetical protein
LIQRNRLLQSPLYELLHPPDSEYLFSVLHNHFGSQYSIQARDRA